MPPLPCVQIAVLTARCYDSAAYAVAPCLSVYPL